MSEVETLYSARQLADELGITLQMLSKYAQAYSKLTKQQIMKQGRDGRHFTATQREIIKNARDMVRLNTGVTVEEALKRALVFDSAPLEVGAVTPGAAVDLAAVDSTLRAALKDEVTTPLIAEMQALRAEIAELRGEVRGNRQTTSTRPVVFGADEWATDLLEAPRQVENPDREENHGYLVRFALWVEQRIRGR